tara:strand:+ start:670 stop:837 length:168 start_codon:yes stop_codon:yes gene_type:complete
MNEKKLYNFFERNAKYRRVNDFCGVYTIEFNGKTIWDVEKEKLFGSLKELNKRKK